MLSLALKAYLQLIVVDIMLTFRDFPALYQRVRRLPTKPDVSADHSAEKICRSVDLACVWYWKQVPCLQRSAVTTMLLRKHGIAASLVIGAQPLPFRAHAWVEACGEVLNDKPYISEMYPVLDRC